MAIPRYISVQYVNGARGFRREKRRQLRALQKALNDLRSGCAFFPCHEHPVDDMQDLVNDLRKALSVKEWGQ